MKKEYKEGVDFVFEQNPELAKLGTKEDYSKYLKTIFPESKVKNIVYHGTTKSFEEFDKDKLGTSTKNITNTLGFYFVPNKKVADIFIKGKKFSMKERKLKATYPKGAKTYGAILNIRKPELIEGDVFQKYAEQNKLPPLKSIGDSIIITPQTNNILPEFSVKNYAVLEPSQIHLLGSKKDIKEFGKYVKNKSKKTQKGNSLENKLISGVFIAFFIAGLFFISPSLTGNVIGNSNISILNIFGVALILIGAVGFFISKKDHKKK